jgi:hypothetical protein
VAKKTKIQNYIVKPKDPSAIVKLQDPQVIEQLLDEPFAVISEVMAGWFASGNGYLATAGVRIVQGALKGRIFQQFAKELKELRAKGRIPEDFAEKPLGYKSWVELLTVLDEEIPDEERLEALKAMFFAVNKVGIHDSERLLNYQLFQIAKRFNSGELLLLKAVREGYKSGEFPNHDKATMEGWTQNMAERLGHRLSALVLTHERALVREGVICPASDSSGHWVDRCNARISDLGIRFCENLQTYQAEKS